jgi:hypothetical protein
VGVAVLPVPETAGGDALEDVVARGERAQEIEAAFTARGNPLDLAAPQ